MTSLAWRLYLPSPTPCDETFAVKKSRLTKIADRRLPSTIIMALISASTRIHWHSTTDPFNTTKLLSCYFDCLLTLKTNLFHACVLILLSPVFIFFLHKKSTITAMLAFRHDGEKRWVITFKPDNTEWALQCTQASRNHVASFATLITNQYTAHGTSLQNIDKPHRIQLPFLHLAHCLSKLLLKPLLCKCLIHTCL